MRGRLPLAWLLAAILLTVGVGSRLSGLGDRPLSPPEAEFALGAAAGTDQASPFWGSGAENAPVPTSYLLPTRMAMTWLGASEAAARAIPALAGVGLLLLPLLWIDRWGWPRVLMVIALLLISTTAWALSRTAGTAVLAALGVAMVLTGFARGREADALTTGLLAVGLAIGVASGAPFWMGAFGLLLSGLIAAAVTRERPRIPVSGPRLTQGLLGAAGLLVALGTLFGANWGALAGTFSGLGDWLSGWAGGGTRWLTAYAVLPIYEPLVLLGSVVGVVQVFRTTRVGSDAAYWAVGALMAYLAYPGRSPADLIWFVIPAAVLTAGWLLQLMEEWVRLEATLPAVLLMVVLATVLVFAYFSWHSVRAGFGLAAQDYTAQLGFVISAIGFGVALVLLFGIGWSWRETGLAASAVIVIALATTTFSTAWGLTFGQSDRRVDLWRPQTSTSNLNLLEDTVRSIANAHVGRDGGLPIGTAQPLPANLAWALRQQRPASLAAGADPPPVVVAAAAAVERSLPADYLGQAFGVTRTWDWVGPLPPSFWEWLSSRRAPTTLESWVLYVRTDVAGLDGSQIDGGLQ